LLPVGEDVGQDDDEGYQQDDQDVFVFLPEPPEIIFSGRV